MAETLFGFINESPKAAAATSFDPDSIVTSCVTWDVVVNKDGNVVVNC